MSISAVICYIIRFLWATSFEKIKVVSVLTVTSNACLRCMCLCEGDRQRKDEYKVKRLAFLSQPTGLKYIQLSFTCLQ